MQEELLADRMARAIYSKRCFNEISVLHDQIRRQQQNKNNGKQEFADGKVLEPVHKSLFWRYVKYSNNNLPE